MFCWRRWLSAALAALGLCALSAPVRAEELASPQPGQHAYTFTFRQRNGRLFRMNYLLFLPRSYNASDGQRWLLLVFLH
ncbi:MAG: hypothetical protein ACK4WM_09045, partial [Thermoflexales bacterium]